MIAIPRAEPHRQPLARLCATIELTRETWGSVLRMAARYNAWQCERTDSTTWTIFAVICGKRSGDNIEKNVILYSTCEPQVQWLVRLETLEGYLQSGQAQEVES